MSRTDARHVVETRRKAMGYSRDALAEEAKVAPATIKRLERGDRVSGRSLRAICLTLGLDPTAMQAVVDQGPDDEVVVPGPVDAARGPGRIPVAGGDGWSTAWRELALGTAVVVAFVAATVAMAAHVGFDVDATWSPDRLQAYERAWVASRIPFLAGAAATAATLGALAWRVSWHRHARMVEGPRIRIGRSATLPALPTSAWVDGAGRRVSTWPGAVLGIAALALSAMLCQLPGAPVPMATPFQAHAMGRHKATVPVWTVDPDGPAAAAGIRLGDRLVAIDGQPVSDHLEAIVAMRLDEPHRLTARVRRPSGAGTTELDLGVEVAGRTPGCETGSAGCAPTGWVRGFFATDGGAMTAGNWLDAFGEEASVAYETIVDPRLARCVVWSAGMDAACATRWVPWASFTAASLAGTVNVIIAGLAILLLSAAAQGYASGRRGSTREPGAMARGAALGAA